MCVNSQGLQITRNAGRVIGMFFIAQRKRLRQTGVTKTQIQNVLLDSLTARHRLLLRHRPGVHLCGIGLVYVSAAGKLCVVCRDCEQQESSDRTGLCFC